MAERQTDRRTNVRAPRGFPLKSCVRTMSRVAPRTTARAAARLFCYPHGKRRQDPRENDWLRLGDRFTLEAGGRKLAAWSWGDGPTILLHHGWNGRAAQLGAFVQPLVEMGFGVVAYDAPAHGASPGRLTNGIDMARTLVDASRRLGGLHAIVGHSLGCLVTAYAMRRGLPVERLVFVSPPADMITYTRVFADTVGLDDRTHREMLAWFERDLDLDWNDFNAERLAEYDRAARGRQTPLLVVHDRHDRSAPWDHGERYHRAWDGSQFLLTERLGHRRILADEDVLDRVAGFVKD